MLETLSSSWLSITLVGTFATVLSALVPVWVRSRNIRKQAIYDYRKDTMGIALDLWAMVMSSTHEKNKRKKEDTDKQMAKMVQSAEYNKQMMLFNLAAYSRSLKAYMEFQKCILAHDLEKDEGNIDLLPKMGALLKAMRRDLVGINWFNMKADSLSILDDTFSFLGELKRGVPFFRKSKKRLSHTLREALEREKDISQSK